VVADNHHWATTSIGVSHMPITSKDPVGFISSGRALLM
jgi:hypothetical protein